MENLVPKLFQDEPAYSKRSSFRLKSWTETVLGYLYEASKLARCLLRNRDLMGRDYPLAITINIEVELRPEEIKAIWTKVSRKLGALGLVALWVREPSRSNRCHYHLIVKSDLSVEVVKQIIGEAMPDRSVIPWHIYVDRVRSQYHYARYVGKAKTPGYLAGNMVADKYRCRRLLFRSGLDLRKVGTIGTFWELPKKQIWDDIIQLERRIGEGLNQPGIKELALHVYELLDATVPLSRIERSFGYSAFTPQTREWAASVASVA